jgi:hypothetical protein
MAAQTFGGVGQLWTSRSGMSVLRL